jgi:ATP-dependent Clp protease ATP-binding subunit ClpC
VSFERYTEVGKKVHEYALREALSLGHNYIGPEHILLALSRLPADSVVGRVLFDQQTSDDWRNAVIAEVIRPCPCCGQKRRTTS